MEKAILALQGIGNSGKTASIRMLYYKLEKSGYKPTKVFFDNLRENGKGDFGVLFLINDITIGITSIGDTYHDVSKNLKRFGESQASLYLCACRTYDVKGRGTNYAIAEFAKANVLKVEFYEKKFSKVKGLQQAVNEADCNRLFEALFDHIKSN